MIKLSTLALAAALIVPATVPAFAADSASTQADVNANAGDVVKDDAAIAHQDGNIAVNRAEKADAKATGAVAAQAGNSVEIGANKTARAEKTLEKKTDTKLMHHNQKRHADAVAKEDATVATPAQ